MDPLGENLHIDGWEFLATLLANAAGDVAHSVPASLGWDILSGHSADKVCSNRLLVDVQSDDAAYLTDLFAAVGHHLDHLCPWTGLIVWHIRQVDYIVFMEHYRPFWLTRVCASNGLERQLISAVRLSPTWHPGAENGSGTIGEGGLPAPDSHLAHHQVPCFSQQGQDKLSLRIWLLHGLGFFRVHGLRLVQLHTGQPPLINGGGFSAGADYSIGDISGAKVKDWSARAYLDDEHFFLGFPAEAYKQSVRQSAVLWGKEPRDPDRTAGRPAHFDEFLLNPAAWLLPRPE
jgi:hypothetical protein